MAQAEHTILQPQDYEEQDWPDCDAKGIPCALAGSCETRIRYDNHNARLLRSPYANTPETQEIFRKISEKLCDVEMALRRRLNSRRPSGSEWHGILYRRNNHN